ncbi:polyketide synthase PksJ [Duganella sacchari]|uniref:Polyketide synthase PksJ n=1 Tax=Duganella sacchari TaxID=551987 RepID=A0A1M7KY04_9BURK|nr:beta-ketoacyl synthase N-terminal-like domain-containing protein [Duganella sacchari]SHM70506.1 polyketide synthase PksJ [Duganella sacchari]
MVKLLNWLAQAASPRRTAPEAAPAAPAAFSGTTTVSEVAGPRHAFPFEQRLERLFFDRSTAWSDRIAAFDEPVAGTPRQLRYGELRQRALVLAAHLRQMGVQPGQVVGVYLERCADLQAAIMGIWALGAVYLPLDRTFPQAYLQTLCDIARPVAMLTTSTGGFAAGQLPQLALDTLDYSSGAIAIEALPVMPASAPALIMFTSGSTGQPKGVRHSQLQLINRLYWMWQEYPFRSGDVIGQRSPINVMPSMWELLGGLLAGVPTAIAPESTVREPGALFGWLGAREVSHLTLNPQLIQLLLDLRQNGAPHPQRLRRVINGGPLSAAVQQRFLLAFPQTELLHDFGCTETNTYLHDAVDHPGAAVVTVQGGYRPIANTTVRLLDAQMQPVARGAEGEVYLSGPCLAMDYLGQPTLTAERFLPGTVAGLPAAERLFRTGEMARMATDGTLRMTGRYDHQVKINGLRVELEHVELVLSEHPAIAEVAVVAQQLSELHIRLLAFWVARPGMDADVQPLRAFVASRLPAHMVPGSYTELSALPRRPNGKIDRVVLQQTQGDVPAMLKSAASVPQATEPVLITVAAELLGVAPEDIDPQREFDSLGLDSGMLMSFATSASLMTGLDVQVARCFDYPSIALLARHLDQTGAPAPAASESAASTTVNAQDGIAIIGISLRVPGAHDYRSFWNNLKQGIESVGPVPAERWDGEAYYDADMSVPGRSNSKWGGFLSDIDQFEPLFFNLAPKEAALMDPQQRLCLMESWRALEDAGYAPDSLHQQQVGVFVGAREPDYAGLGARQGQPSSAATLLGSDMSLIAARISYFLNLNGPSLVVDTACSSSMTALHLACQSLRSGESDMVLAGGVCLTLDPEFYVASSKLGIFSPTGHCRAFDAAADGFVHGEGVAFTVLKPLQAALRDGDHVYAVIRGTALNQDGRSNGITAPNGLAQTSLQTGLYRRLGIDAGSIGYVEAHGTGTALGDVVELQALTRSFQADTTQTGFCAIGSVKPNIGHLTTAAGMAGLVKTALCLHHATLVPSINYQTPNPKIDFDRTPFYVNTEVRPWAAGTDGVRRAVINSFGIGGTNGHCVLEQAPAMAALTETSRCYLVPLTARTEAALGDKLRDLQQWLHQGGSQASASAVAYTLSCGRSHFDHGVLLAFHDLAELKSLLENANANGRWTLKRQPPVSTTLREQGNALWHQLSAGARRSDLDTLAALIVQGYWPDWASWFTPQQRHRVALPAYPFQTERCWLAAPVAPRLAVAIPVAPAVLPAAVQAIQPMPDIALPLAAVRAILGAELGMAADDIDPDASLSDYGMESVKAINLRFQIEAQLGVDLEVQDIVGADSAASLARLVQQASAITAVDDEAPLDDVSEEQLIALFNQLSTNPDRSYSHAN